MFCIFSYVFSLVFLPKFFQDSEVPPWYPGFLNFDRFPLKFLTGILCYFQNFLHGFTRYCSWILSKLFSRSSSCVSSKVFFVRFPSGFSPGFVLKFLLGNFWKKSRGIYLEISLKICVGVSPGTFPWRFFPSSLPEFFMIYPRLTLRFLQKLWLIFLMDFFILLLRVFLVVSFGFFAVSPKIFFRNFPEF